MPISPNATNALAAGFQGQNLADQMLQRQIAARAQQQQVQEQQNAIQRQARARAALGQALQAAGVPPVTPQQPGASPQGSGLPAAGQNSLAAGPGAQPGAAPPGGQPQQPQQKPFSWSGVRDQILTMDLDPETRASAMQELAPLLDKEANLGFKQQQGQDTLAFKYYDAQRRSTDLSLTLEQRAAAQKEANDLKLQITREGNDTKTGIADKKNLTAVQIAQAKIQSAEQMASDALDWKKEFGRSSLDIRADQIGKNFLVQQRAQDLVAKGLEEKHAEFVAKQEALDKIATMRDETARRGQDLAHSDRQAALDFKLQGAQAKAALAMGGVEDSLDQLVNQADMMLKMPGLEDATGPIRSHILTVFGDTRNFETQLETLKSKVALGALGQMKALSATGASGLGSVSNFEQQMLQNSMGPLSLNQTAEQFRDTLLNIKAQAQASKARLNEAYGKAYTPKATGTDGRGVPVATPQPGAASIDTPQQFVNMPGAVFRDKSSGKMYTVQQGGKSVETK